MGNNLAYKFSLQNKYGKQSKLRYNIMNLSFVSVLFQHAIQERSGRMLQALSPYSSPHGSPSSSPTRRRSVSPGSSPVSTTPSPSSLSPPSSPPSPRKGTRFYLKASSTYSKHAQWAHHVLVVFMASQSTGHQSGICLRKLSIQVKKEKRYAFINGLSKFKCNML